MRAVVLALTTACGGASHLDSVGNRAAPPPKPTCLEARMHSLAAELQARWNTPSVEIVRCTPGLFPTPGFVVEARAGDDLRVGILDVDGRELAAFAPNPAGDSTLVECATDDLDGDGIDEIVEWRSDTWTILGTSTWLEIRRLDGHVLTAIRGPHTSVSHPELGSCHGDVQLAGQTIVITVKATELPPSDCLTAGTHTFALDRSEVVEINPRVSRR